MKKLLNHWNIHQEQVQWWSQRGGTHKRNMLQPDGGCADGKSNANPCLLLLLLAESPWQHHSVCNTGVGAGALWLSDATTSLLDFHSVVFPGGVHVVVIMLELKLLFSLQSKNLSPFFQSYPSSSCFFEPLRVKHLLLHK